LLVCRLKGTTFVHGGGGSGDTAIGRQGTPGETQVLRQSSQCVPLILFKTTGLPSKEEGKKVLDVYQHMLQEAIDEILCARTAAPCNVPRVFASSDSKPAPVSFSAAGSVDLFSTIRYVSPDTLSFGDSAYLPSLALPGSGTCCLCLSEFSFGEDCVALKACNHQFHKSCVCEALKHSSNCPKCRKVQVQPRGRMPSGTMIVVRSKLGSCTGYESVGHIAIGYDIPGGLQKTYHPNPGTMFAGTNRTAFLPDNEEGRKLLSRLRCAFRCGLTFTVGSSLSTGKDNVTTWGSVHHKTSRTGGTSSHGFPDPGYFINANEELDSLGIPK